MILYLVYCVLRNRELRNSFKLNILYSDSVDLTRSMLNRSAYELNIYESSQSINPLFNQSRFIVNTFCCYLSYFLVKVDNNFLARYLNYYIVLIITHFLGIVSKLSDTNKLVSTVLD